MLYSETGQGSSYNYSLEPTYEAQPGERNQLTVSVGEDAKGATAILFTDPGAVIEPGHGCISLDAHRVRCEDEDDLGVNLHSTVSLGDGDDTVRTTVPSVLAGGNGDDALIGSSDRDLISGDAGDDTIQGGGDEDTLDGGRGTDEVKAGSGDDRIQDAGGMEDTLDGGAGRDLLDLSARRRSVLIDLSAGVSGSRGEGRFAHRHRERSRGTGRRCPDRRPGGEQTERRTRFRPAHRAPGT